MTGEPLFDFILGFVAGVLAIVAFMGYVFEMQDDDDDFDDDDDDDDGDGAHPAPAAA